MSKAVVDDKIVEDWISEELNWWIYRGDDESVTVKLVATSDNRELRIRLPEHIWNDIIETLNESNRVAGDAKN